MTRPAEIPFKRWMAEEARRQGITYAGLWSRFRRHGYHGPPRRVVNRRVIFVENRAAEIPEGAEREI